MATSVHDNIITSYLEEEGGIIVYLSDDTTFTRVLRNIISRDIGFKGEALFPFSNQSQAMTKCIELRDSNTPIIIFVERMLNDRPTTDFIIRLKKDIPDIRVIILTWEATQETVAYFFELGVSRVLVKPASANKVIEELARAINPPGELKRQLKRCRSFLDNEDFDEALEVTDRILLLQPDSAQGLTMRGDALMGIEETDKAVQSYMAAHESKPIFMEPLIKLAEAFKGMDDERALAYMKTLDEISPLNPERKIAIAEQHLLRNETEEAEAYLDKGVEAAERETLSMVGDLAERIADAVSGVAPHLAVKYLTRVIDTKRVLGRDDLVHFNRLGILLRGEGKWNEAVDVYDKALAIVPDDPVVHYNKGLAFWEGNERYKALQCFETALELDPFFYTGSVGAALNVGSLYLDMRQFEDAEPFLQHVLDLDPENATAQKRLKDAQQRIPPKRSGGSSRERESSGGGSYDMDALVSDKVAKRPKPRKSGGSGGYDMDAMVGGSSAKPAKKNKGGTSFNVDEMSGGPPRKAREARDGRVGSSSKPMLDVDSLADESDSRPKRKKKKSGKVTKLDF